MAFLLLLCLRPVNCVGHIRGVPGERERERERGKGGREKERRGGEGEKKKKHYFFKFSALTTAYVQPRTK